MSKREERDTAISTLIAALRVAYQDGIAAARIVIQGTVSPGDSAVAQCLTIMETVSTNTITSQQVTDLNAQLALIQSGTGVMTTSIMSSYEAMVAANAGMRAE